MLENLVRLSLEEEFAHEVLYLRHSVLMLVAQLYLPGETVDSHSGEINPPIVYRLANF